MPPQDLPGSVPIQAPIQPPPQAGGHPFLPLLIVFIVLIVGGSFFFFRFPSFWNMAPGQGTLYLGLAPLNSTETKLYSYNLDTKQLAPVPTQLFGANTITFSPDGKLSALVGWQQNADSQVYVSSLQTNNLYQLTHDNLLYKRLPQWSPDGKHIAFTATATSTLDQFSDWSGYVVDMQGVTNQISSGAHPVWISSNEGLILRTDGLYLFNLTTKTVVKVIPVDRGEVRLNMRLAVSPARDKFAWTLPEAGKVYIYRIVPGDSSAFQKIQEINTHGFWAVFSPDGSELAVQEVDWDTLNTNPRPRIAVFDVTTAERTQVLDLSDYNQQHMFFSDWK